METLAVAANVAIEEEANALIAAATEANGRVDVLVNNAGITRDGLAAACPTTTSTPSSTST